ncbi:PBECR4 domain-containing protein [Streptococcus sp. CF8-6]|uniref:PBECR4 domain-containing protein n=1 Tax=Streptococcus sp. CF8-6 TaxID=2963150 RepID=UPI0020C84FFC|nr:PBECR4 domain-containing protein [Streptococcus sp. CF8-6]MCP9017091.1 PBECR4 domain-containing protein [Streptococcus sp. CF8-6]
MKQEIKINGVGYFDSFFSAVDISTMANSLKKFVLEEHITEDSKPGEILNQFIGTIIRQIDLDEFKKLSPHLFTYPVHYEDILEVEQIPASYNQLHYLQENIDSLLQIKTMTTQRREEKSMTSIENLKNLSILEVADKLGMEVKRTGTHTFSWKEHDSFTLNTRDNYFNWFARSIGGDVIKMVQVVQEELTGEKYTFKQAKHFLENQEISVASATIVSEKEHFKYYLEPFETDLREAREYLHNIRGLSNETIDFFIGKEVLAQATKKSEDYFEPVIVFKSLDKHNEVIGASLQGIVENHSRYDKGRLKQIMRSSDGTTGMNVDIGEPKRLIFAESPIDLMSYYELHKDNLQDVRLVAMDGLKESTVSRHVAELLSEVGELNDEVDQEKKSSFLAETAKLSTFFKDGNHQDLITLAIDNDDAGHAFIEKLTAKKIGLTADLPSKMEGIEKMAWNDYLKMSEEKALDNSQGQIKKIENVVGDFSENSQKAAPLPEANKSQPLNGSSPNQTQSQSSLHFTILDEEKSIYKPNYHPINANELRKLNRYAPQLQQTAIWYLNTVADSKVSYFFKEEDEIKMVSVFFKKENFMHLTGIAPVKENQSSEKSLLDFVEGKGEFDHIMIANRGAAFKKLQVLSDFEAVIDASSFYFDNLYQIEKFNRINLSQAIIAKDKSLLLALRDIDGVGVPTSVMKVSKNMSYELEGNEKIILGVFRERKGHIDKLSINEEYVKDGGEELLSILKNEEAKKIAEATKEEATRDTDGDRKSNHEEHSFGSRPIDNNHLKEKPLNRSQEIVSDSEQQKIERTYQYKGYLQSEAEGSTSPVLETSTFERSVTSRPTLSSQHLNFTIKGGFKSTKTSIDHSIDEYDLNKLNRRGHDIQKAAQFYRDNLANSKINYFTSDGNIVTVNFLEKNFMHLTGLKIVNKRTPPEQILYDFAKGGELSYEDIRLSNNDFFLDKIKILTDLEVVTKASSFYFSQLQDIPRYQGRFDGLIKADDKDIMILFRATEENGLLPVSVFKTRRILTKELEQANKKIILGVFRERDGHFDKLSINEEYVKDGGEEMLSILKEKKQKEASQDIIQSINTFENNTVKYEGIGMEKEAIFLEKIERIRKENEDKKIAEAKKEELSIDTDGDGIPDAVERNQGTNPYSPDTDGDGKSDHEEISFGSNPIDSNHPQKEQVKSLSEIIDMKNPKELYNVLKDGIKDYFESDTYKEYLTAMSKFHEYSPRNVQLILKQNPQATLVTSYSKWKNEFERHVNKGEKPLRIMAPVSLKKRDPITKEPILDKDGNEQIFTSFRLVSVFDISQTSGKELPKPVYELKGTFKDYAVLYKSMKEVSEKNGVPIRFEDIGTGSGGYYSRQNNEIVIQTGMSEKQTLKTIIHEMAHSELHSIEKILDNPLSRSERELQAESVAFVVSNHYGIDTSEYTFGYLASWTEDKEGLKDLEEQINIVQKEANILITKIDTVLEKYKSKEITKNAFEEKIDRLKSEKVIQSEERSQSPKKELSSDKEANL